MLKQQIHYRLPSPPDSPTDEWIRLTVGPCSALAMARRRRYIREAQAWIEETLGVELPLPDDVDEITKTAAGTAWARASMLAALIRLEAASCPVGTEPTEWQEIQWPEAWNTVEGFVNEVPDELGDVWAVAAAQCNPGLFSVDMSDEAKKKERLYVTSSMTRLIGS